MNLTAQARVVEVFLHELGHPPHWGVHLTNERITISLTEPHPDFAGLDVHDIDFARHTFRKVDTLRKGHVVRLTWMDLDKKVNS